MICFSFFSAYLKACTYTLTCSCVSEVRHGLIHTSSQEHQWATDREHQNVPRENMLRSHCIYMDAPWIVKGGNEFNNVIYFELSQLSSRCLWFHTSPFLPHLSDEAAEVKVCCHFRIKRHSSTCCHVSDPRQAPGDCMWQVSCPTQELFPVMKTSPSLLLIFRKDRT